MFPNQTPGPCCSVYNPVSPPRHGSYLKQTLQRTPGPSTKGLNSMLYEKCPHGLLSESQQQHRHWAHLPIPQSRRGRCYNGNGKGSVSRRRQVEELPAEICTTPSPMHNYCLGPQIFKFNHIRVSLLFYSLSIIKDISRWRENFKSQWCVK